jgi:hypothetical protein
MYPRPRGLHLRSPIHFQSFLHNSQFGFFGVYHKSNEGGRFGVKCDIMMEMGSTQLQVPVATTAAIDFGCAVAKNSFSYRNRGPVHPCLLPRPHSEICPKVGIPTLTNLPDLIQVFCRPRDGSSPVSQRIRYLSAVNS